MTAASTSPAGLDESPGPDLAAEPPTASRGSLARAEVHRFVSRRFIRVLLVLAALGYVAITTFAGLTQFAKPSEAGLADARQSVEKVVAEQDAYRQQCINDPGRPSDVSAEEACGPKASASDFRVEDFIDKPPFVLGDNLPDGAVAVAAATAALAFLIGATYVGAEWSTKSMVALLFWEPRRLKVMGVKLAVTAAAAAVLAVVAQAAWLGTAEVLAHTRGTTGGLPKGFWGDLAGLQGRSVLLVVATGLLGFGIANLIRNTGASLGVGFVYFAIVETAVRALKPAWQEWLVTDNAAALLLNGGHRLFLYDPGFVDETGQIHEGPREVVMSNVHGGLVLGLVTAVLVATGVLLFKRRDLQ